MRGASAPLSAAAYDRQWERLGDFARFNPGARHRRRLIAGLVSELPIQGAIDVGCGTGEMLLLLSAVKPEVSLYGVDLSPAVIQSNRKAMAFCDFDVFDLEKDQLAEQYDLVVCSEVIEHLGDWRSGVSSLAEMVAPGGFLLITTPTGRIYPTERAFGHVEHPSVGELIEVASSSELAPVDVFNWGYPSYALLKKLTNLRPEWAMSSFGSGEYGGMQRAVSRLAYLATSLSIRDHRRGCQIVALFARAGR